MCCISGTVYRLSVPFVWEIYREMHSYSVILPVRKNEEPRAFTNHKHSTAAAVNILFFFHCFSIKESVIIKSRSYLLRLNAHGSTGTH